jgi:hypothetical protein
MYMWDYDFPFSPGQVPPWPQFHHDARRTGLATNQPFVGVDDKEPAKPPAQIELALGSSNPAHSGSRIRYAVPANLVGASLDLAVYDLAGRRLRTIENGLARPGRQSAVWDLRDSADHLAGAGVYFLRLAVGNERRAQKLVILQ